MVDWACKTLPSINLSPPFFYSHIWQMYLMLILDATVKLDTKALRSPLVMDWTCKTLHSINNTPPPPPHLFFSTSVFFFYSHIWQMYLRELVHDRVFSLESVLICRQTSLFASPLAPDCGAHQAGGTETRCWSVCHTRCPSRAGVLPPSQKHTVNK